MTSPCLTLEELQAAADSRGSISAEHAAHVSSCESCSGAIDAIRADNALAAELARADAWSAPASMPSSTVLLGGRMSGPAPALPPGTRIGRYTITAVLGVGGMGMVYRAEQDAPRRAVALKLIRPELASPSLIRRFEHEAAALAMLKHPGIAQVYEAGVAETAGAPPQRIPYFAMELVDGQRLDEFVKRHAPGRAQVLRLIAALCDAVDHAHRRGVIHRDLKPANVLVEAEGPAASQAASSLRFTPRILDFGVAKLRDPAGDVEATQAGGFVGTLAYAAPEQVAGLSHDPAAVDARADVYALGVILYELLVGQRPYSLDGSLHSVVATITDARIVPPESRGVRLDADLRTILFKSLAADPDRRYQSAALLAEDIRRYLDKRPLLARADSAAYILRKGLARHPFRAAAAALVGLLVLAAGASALLAARAQQVKGRVVETFVDSMRRADQDDDDSTDRVASIDELFDAFAASINEKLGDYPNERDRLLLRLGKASLSHRRFEPSIRILQQVVDERRAGSDRAALAEALHELGRAHQLMGDYPTAHAELTEALTLRTDALGPRHPDTIESRYWVGFALHGWKRYADAEREFVAVIGAARQVEPDSANLAQYLTGLAACVRVQNRPAEALDAAAEALSIIRRVHGPNAKHATVVLGNMAANLIDLDRLDEADERISEAMTIAEVNYGPDDPRVADRLVQRAKLRMKRADKASDPASLLDTAATDAQRTLELRRRVFRDADHESVAEALSLFGQIRVRQGRLGEAKALLSEALQVRQRLPRRNDGALGHSESLLGDCLRRMDDRAAAEPLLRSGLERVRAAYGPDHLRTREARERLDAFNASK